MVAGETTWLFRVGRGGQLDLSAIESVYAEEDRGQPPYHPRMMTKIWSMGYCVGGIFLAPDPEASGGRRRFSGVGGGEPAGLPHPIGFSEASSDGAGRAIPAGVTITLERGTMSWPRGLDGSKVKANASSNMGDELWDGCGRPRSGCRKESGSC